MAVRKYGSILLVLEKFDCLHFCIIVGLNKHQRVFAS